MNEPLKWYKYVPRLQRSLNSNISRSTGRTPFELMFGVQMTNSEDYEMNKIIEAELINEFENERNNLRINAKNQIQKTQIENCHQYNKRRKEPAKYNVGDLVAIKRTQGNAKLASKFIGPYEITKTKRNNRYDVKKIGHFDGPIQTSTAADYMKLWVEPDESSGSDDDAGWPDVGTV